MTSHFVECCLTGNAQTFEPLVRHYQNAAFATALGYAWERGYRRLEKQAFRF